MAIYEYEFRLVAHYDAKTANQWLETIADSSHLLVTTKIIYAKPHFRFRQAQWEWKERLSAVTFYNDGLWFNLIESKEIPFREWSRNFHSKFVDEVGFNQNPFVIEERKQVCLSSQAKVYAFRKNFQECGIVFEYELGTFARKVKNYATTMSPDCLASFRSIYSHFRTAPSVPYTLNLCTRKPVKPILANDVGLKTALYALKHDGTFGFVYSFADHVCEMWEGNCRQVRRGETLGDGIVFAAEKMPDGTVYLLDVYQVRGYTAVGRKSVLMDFLPNLKLIPGYKVQTYYPKLPENSSMPGVDGIIVHDVSTDEIYKIKTKHTVDLVYHNGRFLLPNGEFVECLAESMVDGAVYECDLDANPIRRRKDRFTGNTKEQLFNIFDCLAA